MLRHEEASSAIPTHEKIEGMLTSLGVKGNTTKFTCAGPLVFSHADLSPAAKLMVAHKAHRAPWNCPTSLDHFQGLLPIPQEEAHTQTLPHSDAILIPNFTRHLAWFLLGLSSTNQIPNNNCRLFVLAIGIEHDRDNGLRVFGPAQHHSKSQGWGRHCGTAS